MKKSTALKSILIISLVGMTFSGVLSYFELFGKTCIIGGGCTSLASVPACVYGFFMYLTVFIISYLGVKSSK